jgi:hypothetical protein
VINDLVDQLSYPMTRVVNSFEPDVKKRLLEIAQHHYLVNTRADIRELVGRGYDLDPEEIENALKEYTPEENLLVHVALLQKALEKEIASAADDSLKSGLSRDAIAAKLKDLGMTMSERRLMTQSLAPPVRQTPAAYVSPKPKPNNEIDWKRLAALRSQATDSESELRHAYSDLREAFSDALAFSVPVSRTRRARLPMPPTQLLDAYDLALLGHVAADVYAGLQGHAVDKEYLHLMDVQGFLQEELQAAYELLSQPSNAHLWEICGPQLAAAIRQRDLKQIKDLRDIYLDRVEVTPDIGGLADGDTTRSLGWAILVQASLLNDRLIEDITEAAVVKRCPTCVIGPEGLPFYLPTPPPEAQMVFNEYVKCRWPIQVFALDPVTQDQNVADAFARRRELQVAMALAFAGGQMNAQALMRFSRRLEWDMATIALNRTVVAFSHGSDTFGWRFQPRFQTPPTPGNLVAFGQTLFGGPSRDSDLSHRELESGIRECTAIVVMPSFVPYATFDVRTNWFKLTDPKCTEISMQDTVRLSRSIQAMRTNAAMCVQCAHLYRDGEVDRLLRRVDQLDRELPLQSTMVQIPYENTSGGFELFNHGITDLAPELVGWYGAPGINPNSTTTMYLVGDGFSVHDTRVIAGGRTVPFDLISRQLMEVQIPTGLQVLTRGRSSGDGEFDPRELDEVVDVHIATPYGVSSHVLVPVARAGTGLSPVANFELQPGGLIKGRFTYNPAGGSDKFTVDSFYVFNQSALVIRVPRTIAVNAGATKQFTFSVKDANQEQFLGRFNVDVPFNPSAYEYYITGTELAGLVSSLNAKVDPYLEYRGSDAPLTVELSVTHDNNVPVHGTFEAEYTKK